MQILPGMERLFVALPLPAATAGSLDALRPAAGFDQRPIATEDLHVTLHFIGSAEPAVVGQSLAETTMPAFDLVLGKPGHFGRRGRRRILWIGIEPSAPLHELHARVAAALAATGFEPEPRPYIPHVTLARLGPRAPARIVSSFEKTPLPDSARRFHCACFALYASRMPAEGARYSILETYALIGQA